MVRTLPKSEQPPHALYRAAQVREFDRVAIEECGMAGGLLMERAGGAAFALLWHGGRLHGLLRKPRRPRIERGVGACNAGF